MPIYMVTKEQCIIETYRVLAPDAALAQARIQHGAASSSEVLRRNVQVLERVEEDSEVEYTVVEESPIQVKRQGRQWGVFREDTLLEGGFFVRGAAEACADRWRAQEVE